MEPWLLASHPCNDPDASRGVIERTHICAHTCSIRRGRDFWLWWDRWVVVGRVYCVVDQQLVVLGSWIKKSSNVVAETRVYEPTARSTTDIEAALPKLQQWQKFR